MEPADQLQVLMDEREVLRTMYQYGHTLDHGPEDEFLDCFTDNGVWESRPRQRPGRPSGDVVYSGRDEQIAFFRQHTHAPFLYHKHLLVEPRIQIDGDEALVESYYVRIDEHPDGPYIRGFGRYRDRLLRCADGRWRFEHRYVQSEDHLQKNQVPSAG